MGTCHLHGKKNTRARAFYGLNMGQPLGEIVVIQASYSLNKKALITLLQILKTDGLLNIEIRNKYLIFCSVLYDFAFF
jgi:hypothetical protein